MTRARTAAWTAASRTIPFFPTSFGPASNCGLMRAISVEAPGISFRAGRI
jgi:hypothetical protein